MQIAINTIPLLSQMTGIGNCIYNLSRHLLELDRQNKYLFYYGYFSKKLQSSREPEEDTRELQFSILRRAKPYIKKFPYLSDIIKKSLEDFNRLRTSSKHIEIYYEPNYIPTGIQARRLVTTVHDFSFHHHPEWHPRGRVQYFRKYFYLRIKNSDLITVDSEYIRQEAQDILNFPAERIVVVPMGFENRLFREYSESEVAALRRAKHLPEKFVLFVGSIEPRKNITMLLQAYRDLPETIKQEFKLVLAGFSGWENKNIMTLINKMKKHVFFLGYLNVVELALLYRAATVFAYPSLYEGFGLPPLEAMACGTPVLVSRVTSLPEVCGDAALYCNPLDKADIAAKLQTLLEDEDLRADLVRKGRNRIPRFTWENAARQMIEVFCTVGEKM